MVQKLADIKGGGGSIKVGTTGTISSLMTKELETIKSAPQTPRALSAKRLQPRKSLDEASTSSGSNMNRNNSNSNINNSITRKNPELVTRKTKSFSKGTHRIPMLASDNVSLDGTPSRQKADKRGTNIVEIVDIKCGHPDKAWASPITSRLKKLGFSKLSESII